MKGDPEIDPDGRRVTRGGEPTHLTLLARHPGQTFTREQIVDRLFGAAHEGLDRGVEAHAKHVRQKLEAQSQLRLGSIGRGRRQPNLCRPSYSGARPNSPNRSSALSLSCGSSDTSSTISSNSSCLSRKTSAILSSTVPSLM